MESSHISADMGAGGRSSASSPEWESPGGGTTPSAGAFFATALHSRIFVLIGVKELGLLCIYFSIAWVGDRRLMGMTVVGRLMVVPFMFWVVGFLGGPPSALAGEGGATVRATRIDTRHQNRNPEPCRSADWERALVPTSLTTVANFLPGTTVVHSCTHTRRPDTRSCCISDVAFLFAATASTAATFG